MSDWAIDPGKAVESLMSLRSFLIARNPNRKPELPAGAAITTIKVLDHTIKSMDRELIALHDVISSLRADLAKVERERNACIDSLRITLENAASLLRSHLIANGYSTATIRSTGRSSEPRTPRTEAP